LIPAPGRDTAAKHLEPSTRDGRQLNAAYRINCIECQGQSQYGKREVFYPKTTLDTRDSYPPNMQSTIGIPK